MIHRIANSFIEKEIRKNIGNRAGAPYGGTVPTGKEGRVLQSLPTPQHQAAPQLEATKLIHTTCAKHY